MMGDWKKFQRQTRGKPHLSSSRRLLSFFCSAAILTSLTARAPYVESLMVRYAAVAALTGPHWTDTSVLDFGLR